jgi:hypothetical protein
MAEVFSCCSAMMIRSEMVPLVLKLIVNELIDCRAFCGVVVRDAMVDLGFNSWTWSLPQGQQERHATRLVTESGATWTPAL